MGRPVSDWDLATSALPEEVQRTFRRTFPTGIEHGTVTVLHRGERYEVTTLRGDGEYSDGRRPDAVQLGVSIEEDLSRRDFTVNAIAFDPLTSDVVDPWAGLADLEARLIRAVGDPAERFGEDGLRVLRAARFAATLGFELHPDTRAAIPGSLGTFAKVTPERVHEEWRKAFEKSAEPSRALAIMRDTGILQITCPAFTSIDEAAWRATLARVDRTPPEHELRMTATLIDLGAPWEGADVWLRERMRASNHERKRVVHLLEHVRVPASESLDDPALRRWLAKVEARWVYDVLLLARAGGADVDALEARVRAELDAGTPLSTGELAVNGKDVMRALDIPPSRKVGEVLGRLLERVHEDPTLATREALLAALPAAYRDVTEGTA
ncbi:MAG: [cytidine(C)-cytidine(C)-adenosine (A)]-adding enzyme [Sandaracinaceae bacterium]|nr:[cytidine(C)-cytidine(C)-adenosine (A)]-adding enzyme [Sandaracinaceae bacterium]